MEIQNSILILLSTLLVFSIISTTECLDGEYRNKKSFDPTQANENSMVWDRSKNPFDSNVMSKKEIMTRIHDPRRLEKIKRQQKKKMKKEKRINKINYPKSKNEDKIPDNTWRGEVLKLFEKTSMNEKTDNQAMGGLEKSLKIPKDASFSPFNEEHLEAAKELVKVFMGVADEAELVEQGREINPRVNHQLFIYALNVALRKKAFGVSPPNIEETLPELFVSDSVMEAAKEKGLRVDNNKIAKNIADDKSLHVRSGFGPNKLKLIQSVKFNQQSSKDKEKRLDYWREDFKLNSLLYNWNIVHTPLEKEDENKMPRRGEMFYNYYNQLLARYNHERLSAGLPPVLPYGDMDKPIKEGVTPHLGAGARKIVGRRPNTIPTDLEEPEDKDLPYLAIEKSFFREYRKNLTKQIRNGELIYKNGETQKISDKVEINSEEKRGIDVLGRCIDYFSTEKDIRTKSCEGLNDLGHTFLARVHDPKQKEATLVGPMDSYIFSAHDPLFYRWHKYLDDIFQEYKKTQRPYTGTQLTYSDVHLKDVHIASDSGPVRSCGEVLTGCSVHNYQLSRGLDFQNDPNVELGVVRLDHFTFTTHIRILNKLQKSVDVNIRVFLAPKYNEKGKTMNFDEQRLLWVLMDEWVQKLRSGVNNIRRSSTESTISETCMNRFIDLEDASGESLKNRSTSNCGCNWPQHLHLPKGTREGMPFQLFTIVTKSHLEENEVSTTKDTCGQNKRRYPDNASLGFPFDRPIKKNIDIKDWISYNRNMFLSNFKIRFTGKNVDPKGPDFQDCPHHNNQNINRISENEEYPESDEKEDEYDDESELETTDISKEFPEFRRSMEVNEMKNKSKNIKKKESPEKRKWDKKNNNKGGIKNNNIDGNGSKKDKTDPIDEEKGSTKLPNKISVDDKEVNDDNNAGNRKVDEKENSGKNEGISESKSEEKVEKRKKNNKIKELVEETVKTETIIEIAKHNSSESFI